MPTRRDDDGNRNKRSSVMEPSKPRILEVLSPGLITDASDDDPSGIATYSRLARTCLRRDHDAEGRRSIRSSACLRVSRN